MRSKNQEVLQLQRSMRQCRKKLQKLQKLQATRAARMAARRLAPPLPRSAFVDPTAPTTQGDGWTARHIPITEIPKRSVRGQRPTDEKRLRVIRNEFWRYLRIRRKRIIHGLDQKLCERQRIYLRRHPLDPQAALTVALCHASDHFKGTLYFQVDLSGSVVVHRERWSREDIRNFLSRYRALINKARSLGYIHLIFVGENDLKRRHRRFDMTHKWYGHRVTFKPAR